MQCSRHHFLPAAWLTRDQNVRIGWADSRDHLEHRLHGRSLSDHRGQIVAAQKLILSLEALPTPERFAQLELRAHDGSEPLILPWFLNEIPRAAAHGFYRQADATP